jgi:hypothetical protein
VLECPLHADAQVKPRRLFDRQVGRAGAFEYLRWERRAAENLASSALSLTYIDSYDQRFRSLLDLETRRSIY